MKLKSFACVGLIEINRLNPEEAAPLFKLRSHTTPIGPQFFTKSAFEGDTANHDHTAYLNFIHAYVGTSIAIILVGTEENFVPFHHTGGKWKCSCTSSSSRMKTPKDVQYLHRSRVICCAIALHIRKKLKAQILMEHVQSTLENRNST